MGKVLPSLLGPSNHTSHSSQCGHCAPLSCRAIHPQDTLTPGVTRGTPAHMQHQSSAVPRLGYQVRLSGLTTSAVFRILFSWFAPPPLLDAESAPFIPVGPAACLSINTRATRTLLGMEESLKGGCHRTVPPTVPAHPRAVTSPQSPTLCPQSPTALASDTTWAHFRSMTETQTNAEWQGVQPTVPRGRRASARSQLSQHKALLPPSAVA